MDRYGVAGRVKFHDSLNGEPFPFDLHQLARQRDTVTRGARAGGGRSGDVQPVAGRLCFVEPESSIPPSHFTLRYIDAAIKELEWSAKHGLAGG